MTVRNQEQSLWKLPRRYWQAEIAALLLVVTVAILFRFWRLDILPPGLHYDEAFNNLYALRIYRGEIHPIFIRENGGEEPLHIYLIAMLFNAVGPTPLGGRVISALAGVVTVVFTYLLAVELFRVLGRQPAGKIGLLASLFMAIWYWPVHYSRVGMEPALVPAVSTTAAYFVWRAIRSRHKADAVLAGLLTAVGMYTYPAGRTVPIIVILIILYHAIFGRRLDRRLIPNFWLGTIAAALALIPLGAFFVQNPQWFLLRMQQTNAFSAEHTDPLIALLKGLRAVLLGVFWRGDVNWRQNIPGRPMFDLIQFLLFAIGAAACSRRFKESPYWFLLMWAGVGLLPTLLTQHPPHFGRALGAAPPLALIVGVGLWTIVNRLTRSQTSPASHQRRAMLAAGVLGFTAAFSGGATLNDYFNRWAKSPELFIAFDAGLRAIGEYVQKLPKDEPVYLSPAPRDWYTLSFSVGDDRTRIQSFNGRECLVIQNQTHAKTHYMVIAWPGEDSRTLSRLQRVFPSGTIAWQVRNQDAVYAVDYVTPTDRVAQFQPEFPRRAQIAGAITFLGYDLDKKTLRPGERLTVSLWWQANAIIPVDYTVFVHLIGPPDPATGAAIRAQHDGKPCDNSYPTPQWVPGNVIWDDYRLTLPADLRPGEYSLEIGMYDLATGERAVMQSAAEPRPSDNALPLKSIQVLSP